MEAHDSQPQECMRFAMPCVQLASYLEGPGDVDDAPQPIFVVVFLHFFLPSQQFFTHLRMCLPGLNQY